MKKYEMTEEAIRSNPLNHLKRIQTENYDTCEHIGNPPYGVESTNLIDGELFTSDGYDWILTDYYCNPIITNQFDDISDYFDGKETETLDMIRYLIADASKKGYVEDVPLDKANEIAKLLGEKPISKEIVEASEKKPSVRKRNRGMEL